MNISAAIDSVPQIAPSASEAGPAPKRIVVAYGFWIFLLSDIIMFAALFASYAVLVHSTAGGPTGAQLFNQCDGCDRNRLPSRVELHLRTDVLGHQFAPLPQDLFVGPDYLRARRRVSHSRDPRVPSMIAIGATPQRSAFLSAFFTLVGCHGLHVTLGLIWMAVMMVQVGVMGFDATVQRRLLCFSLFWHALDIVWVGLFTVVYLMGVTP